MNTGAQSPGRPLRLICLHPTPKLHCSRARVPFYSLPPSSLDFRLGPSSLRFLPPPSPSPPFPGRTPSGRGPQVSPTPPLPGLGPDPAARPPHYTRTVRRVKLCEERGCAAFPTVFLSVQTPELTKPKNPGLSFLEPRTFQY